MGLLLTFERIAGIMMILSFRHPQLSWIEHLIAVQKVGRSNRSGCVIKNHIYQKVKRIDLKSGIDASTVLLQICHDYFFVFLKQFVLWFAFNILNPTLIIFCYFFRINFRLCIKRSIQIANYKKYAAPRVLFRVRNISKCILDVIL